MEAPGLTVLLKHGEHCFLEDWQDNMYLTCLGIWVGTQTRPPRWCPRRWARPWWPADTAGWWSRTCTPAATCTRSQIIKRQNGVAPHSQTTIDTVDHLSVISTSLSLSLFQWSTLQKQTCRKLRTMSSIISVTSPKSAFLLRCCVNLITHSASSQTLSTSPSSEDRATVLMSLTACSMVPGWDHQPQEWGCLFTREQLCCVKNSPWRRSSPSLWPGWLGCAHGKVSASVTVGSRLRVRGFVRPPAAWRRPRPPPRFRRGGGWQRRGSPAPPCHSAEAWWGGRRWKMDTSRWDEGLPEPQTPPWCFGRGSSEEVGACASTPATPHSFLLKGQTLDGILTYYRNQ